MNESLKNINWYPGHMKKTRELIQENLKLVDMVIEVIDARIPVSSRNPIISELTSGKPRVICLNKSDLADAAATALWCRHLAEKEASIGVKTALRTDSMHGKGIKELLAFLTGYQDELNAERTRKKNLRLMIVGVPNCGKSSLINRLTGKKSARTGDKPGVTKGKQWLAMQGGMQLLDTPGILWPKFEDPEVGLDLAFCGSIKDEILDTDTLGMELIGRLASEYPDLLMERYKLEGIEETPLENMEAIARKRGFILGGGRIDYSRCARTVLDEFRSARIGRITLEKVPVKTGSEA